MASFAQRQQPPLNCPAGTISLSCNALSNPYGKAICAPQMQPGEAIGSYQDGTGWQGSIARMCKEGNAGSAGANASSAVHMTESVARPVPKRSEAEIRADKIRSAVSDIEQTAEDLQSRIDRETNEREPWSGRSNPTGNTLAPSQRDQSSPVNSGGVCQKVDAVHASSTSPRGLGHCDGETVLHFENQTSEKLRCFYRFHTQHGWGDEGATDLRAYQKSGGEGSGMYSCSTVSSDFRYICFRNEDADRNGCGSKVNWNK